jgi:hypothetical protein
VGVGVGLVVRVGVGAGVGVGVGLGVGIDVGLARPLRCGASGSKTRSAFDHFLAALSDRYTTK